MSIGPRDPGEKFEAAIAIAAMVAGLFGDVQVPGLFAANLPIQIVGHVGQDFLYADSYRVGLLVNQRLGVFDHSVGMRVQVGHSPTHHTEVEGRTHPLLEPLLRVNHVRPRPKLDLGQDLASFHKALPVLTF